MKRRNRFRASLVRAIESLSAVLADDSFSVLVVPVLGPDEEILRGTSLASHRCPSLVSRVRFLSWRR
jgi:hypothetical protein